MKKFILCAALAATTSYMYADGNLNLAARMLLDSRREQGAKARESAGDAAESPIKHSDISESPVRVLFVLAEGHSVDELQLRRLDMVAQIGNVVAAAIDIADLEALDSSDAVTQVELDLPAEGDLAHATMGAQSGVEYAWRGYAENDQNPLPHGFSGRGVVCGIYDKGMDPNHIAFSKRGDISESRVKGLYRFSDGNGGYTEPELESFTTDNASETHGTHVLGIMAGAYDGSGTYCEWEFNSGIQMEQYTATGVYDDGKMRAYRGVESIPYSGVAYDADILVGCGGYYQGNILKMAEIVRDYARTEGKPAVLNLSIGNQMGAKDGTSAFCKALDEIAEEVIVCISASNTGSDKATISRTFGKDCESFRTFLVPKKAGDAVSEAVEIWSASDVPFTARLFTYDSETAETRDLAVSEGAGPTVHIRKNDLGDGFSGSLAMASAVQSQNSRYLLTIQATGFKVTDATRSIGIEVSGPEGLRVDMQGHASSWSLEGNDVEGFTDGSGEHSVNDFATGKNVFCVGNYTSRQVWGKLNSLYTQPGGGYGSTACYTGTASAPVLPRRIHPSSSYATLVDGRTLPHVTAPGSVVVSACSRYYDLTKTDASAYAKVGDEEYFWLQKFGTSMSTPFFAGVCALWLEANPELGHDGIAEVLAHSGAARDEFTAEAPVRYGYGKVDAYGGLRYILENMSGVGVVDGGGRDIAVKTSEGEIEVTGRGESRITGHLTTMSGVNVVSAEGPGSLRIATSGLPAGIYVLCVETHDSSISRKVVVR